MRKFVLASVLASMGTLLAAESFAQGNPATLVAQRKGAMQLQGKYFGPIFAMAQGRVPYDARIAQRNVDYLTVITQLAWDGFDPATAGAQNTNAKDEIYADLPRFRTRSDGMQAEVQKLAAAVKAGDQAAITGAARSVAGACNSCHEANSNFRFRFPL